jgi:hypothetical protein
MKIRLFFPTLLLFIISCSVSKHQAADSLTVYNHVDSLIKHKSFFAARDSFQTAFHHLTRVHQLKLGAELDNVFNRLANSNQKADSLLMHFNAQLSNEDKYKLYRLKQMNHSKLFEYAAADEAILEMLNKYPSLMTPEDLDDFRNTRKIWAALRNQPKQVVELPHDARLTMKTNQLGLHTLPVANDSTIMDFIFDTGANFSTVTESTAQKMNIQVLDTTQIDVGSITGEKVKARIGIAPALQLGEIRVMHAVFLVFPDKALAIPQLRFQINGIIGYPVIEAFKEIQLTPAGDCIIPVKRSEHSEQNLAIDFLTPVISLDGTAYTFDSGANATTLFSNYYQLHRDEIDKKYKETSISFAGAGGHTTKTGYVVSFTTHVNGQEITLDSVQLFREKLKGDEVYPGNIGQDLIRKFSRMTLNFESMFIRFD